MRILVTGGSGFLGTHIKEHFGADDFSRRTGMDLLNPLDTPEAGEYDVVIHLGAQLDKSPGSADSVFRTNVAGTVNLLKSMKEGSTFIFASTKDVYGRFADTYDEVPEDCPTTYSGQSALEWSKLIAEKYVSYYGFNRKFRTCIFRLSTVYAPRSEGNTPTFVTHYADKINLGEPLRLPGGGKPVRDVLHVGDLASACKAFIDSVIPNGLYNLGGGRENAQTLRGIFERIEEVSGYQGIIDEENPLPDPVPFNYVSDISLITRELDWTPAIGFEEGLRTLFTGPSNP